MRITVLTPDTLRSNVILARFGDSFATAGTASAFLGVTVRSAPMVTVFGPAGSATANETEGGIAVESNYIRGNPLKLGWILFAVLVGIASLSVCCCFRGWGEKRLRDIDLMRREDRVKLNDSSFFSVVDSRVPRRNA